MDCRWFLLVAVLCYSSSQARAVSLNRLGALTREQLLGLDREVSRYYSESYSFLHAAKNSTNYDEQLFRSVRSLRHTVVLNLFDYKYTDNQTKWNSMGRAVDAEQCRKQLRLLALMAGRTRAPGQFEKTPLSIVDFQEASGRSGSSVLNGNFVWLGSYNSCVRARIAASIWRQFLGLETDDEYQQVPDIKGRYCVSHLRATSWPKWDDYFEDRLTLKRGVCMPETCHTAILELDAEMRLLVDYLSRADLAYPFNSTRYETSEIYCLPDEDSPHRQMDLGAKLFLVFVSCWALLTVYTNVKYYRTQTAMQKLRNAVDIKMIINEKLDDTASSYRNSDDEGGPAGEKYSCELERPAGGRTGQLEPRDSDHLASGEPAGASSAASSVAATPLPSGVDEDDSDTTRGLIDPFSAKRRRKRRRVSPKANVNFSYTEGSAKRADGSLDLVRAFSFEANLEFLLKPRPSRAGALRNSRGEWGDRAGDEAPARRVDIDVLDGMKVIATSWIVWGHTMMFFFGLLVDLRFGTERMFDLTMLTTINTLQVVGLFYIITGCLLTYFSFNRAKPRQLLNPVFWLLVLVGRYGRLIPAYALVFWFARHVAPHTGYGPGFYDYRTDAEHARGACANESWWVMWTMSAADIKIPLDCIPQAWYLSDDFRTLLVLPVYVALLARSAPVGYAAILATFVHSNFKLAQILREAKIDYRVMLLWQPHVYALMADRLHEVYTNASVRMSTYLLGVIVGHLLYLYETRYIRQWPGWFRACGMKLALALAGCFFLGAPILASPLVNQFLPAREHVDSDKLVWLIPAFKSAMELSVCVMILLLVTGGGLGFVRRLLASQAMKILSNLSYAVFLTHVEIMYKVPAHQMDSDYWHLVKHAVFFIALAHALAFVVHVFFEMPVNLMTRHLFGRAFKLVAG